MKINRLSLALRHYQVAVNMAQHAGDEKLQSIAVSHLADSQEKAGDAKSAALSYQRALRLDQKSSDSRGEAIEWFSYGQFLGRHKQSDDLVYACMLRAEDLLKDKEGPELDTVRSARRTVEGRLGKGAAKSQTGLPQLLATASSLPPAAF